MRADVPLTGVSGLKHIEVPVKEAEKYHNDDKDEPPERSPGPTVRGERLTTQ
jgi:hypothetical protein